jgi:hypothetical protein
VGFEPKISAGEQPQTHALDRAATGIGTDNKRIHKLCKDTYFQTSKCTEWYLDLPQNIKRNIMQHYATSPKIWRQGSTLCDLYDCKCLILIYTSNGRLVQSLPKKPIYINIVKSQCRIMRTAICRQECKWYISTAVVQEWDRDAAISSIKIMYIISIHIQHIQKVR